MICPFILNENSRSPSVEEMLQSKKRAGLLGFT